MSCTGISSSRSFNAHYDERCFLPIHVYDTERARVPSRSCCAPARPRRVSRCAPICAGSCAISANAGPRTRASPSEATATMPGPRRWNGCEANHIDYVFGLPGSKPLSKKIDEAADAVRTERALSNKPVVREATPKARHKAKSWSRERRAVARIKRATPLRARHPLCRHQRRIRRGRRNGSTTPSIARAGQAENLIKLHKTRARFRSNVLSFRDRKSRSASRCARRLTWLMLTVRDAIPKLPPPPPPPREKGARSRERRVLDPAAAADQDRRPRHRNREPRPSRFRRAACQFGGRPASAACPEPLAPLEDLLNRRGKEPLRPSSSLQRVLQKYRSVRR